MSLEGEGTQSSQEPRLSTDLPSVQNVKHSVTEHRLLASSSVGIDHPSQTLEGNEHAHHQQVSSGVLLDVDSPPTSGLPSSNHTSQRHVQHSHLPHRERLNKQRTTKNLPVCMVSEQ